MLEAWPKKKAEIKGSLPSPLNLLAYVSQPASRTAKLEALSCPYGGCV
jgi:hypothetical protein